MIIPVDYGNAVLSWTFSGNAETFHSTMGLFKTGDTDPNEAADAVADAATSSGSIASAAVMYDNWQFDGVTVYWMTDGGLVGGANTDVVVGTKAFTTGQVSPPANCCFVASKLTTHVGRQFRGRMYLPASSVHAGQIAAGGQWASGVAAAIQARVETFNTVITTAGYQPYLLHTAPAVGTTPDPTLITGYIVRSQVGTQRRRFNR